MTILKKRLPLTLTLALFTMLIGAHLALAETNTSAENIEDTPSTLTQVANEIGADLVLDADPEATGQQEADPEIVTEDGSSEIPVTPENPEEAIPPVLNGNGEVVPPGTLPDSPFYWLTTLIEKIHVILTFDPVEKTELIEEQGLERIAEAVALIEQGDTEQAEVALNAYTKKVAEAQEFLAQLGETETRLKLETALSTTHAKNIITLGGLLEKLPEQAAQRVALNIVRSMENSIAKMDKKDLRMAAQELKKVTKGLEDSELAEEDEAALENLDQTLEEGELEDIATNSDTTLNSTTLATKTLADAAAQTSKLSSQSLVQNVKSSVVTPKAALVQLEPTKSQEQKQESKVQEQKQQDSKIKTDQESTVQIENPSPSNDTQKQDVEKSQPKAQNDGAKGGQSGGKGKEK